MEYNQNSIKANDKNLGKLNSKKNIPNEEKFYR